MRWSSQEPIHGDIEQPTKSLYHYSVIDCQFSISKPEIHTKNPDTPPPNRTSVPTQHRTDYTRAKRSTWPRSLQDSYGVSVRCVSQGNTDPEQAGGTKLQLNPLWFFFIIHAPRRAPPLLSPKQIYQCSDSSVRSSRAFFSPNIDSFFLLLAQRKKKAPRICKIKNKK